LWNKRTHRKLHGLWRTTNEQTMKTYMRNTQRDAWPLSGGSGAKDECTNSSVLPQIDAMCCKPPIVRRNALEGRATPVGNDTSRSSVATVRITPQHPSSSCCSLDSGTELSQHVVSTHETSHDPFTISLQYSAHNGTPLVDTTRAITRQE